MMANEVAPGTDQVQRIEFRAMGSQILAAVESADPRAGALLTAVPGWFAAWEQTLSRFREDSELSRLNRTAGGGALLPVSATLWSVLQVALEAAQATAGLVTPAVLNALEAAGYTVSFDALPPEIPPYEPGGGGAPASGLPDWRAIRLDPDRLAVGLPAGLRLDFGGVAKGWAADEAARRLAAPGPALVDAGGDIAVSGPLRDGTGWLIGIEAPAGPDMPADAQLDLLEIRAGGVATSGRDYRRWQQGGAWRHHIIDPRTGAPAETDVVAATVVAPTASAAEIAAKVAFLLGGGAGLAWLEARPALAGLLVLETGSVLRSRRLGDYLWSTQHGS